MKKEKLSSSACAWYFTRIWSFFTKSSSITVTNHWNTHLDYFRHLLYVYYAVAVHVVHPERPFQLLFRCTAGCHIDGQQKFLGNRAKLLSVSTIEWLLRGWVFGGESVWSIPNSNCHRHESTTQRAPHTVWGKLNLLMVVVVCAGDSLNKCRHNRVGGNSARDSRRWLVGWLDRWIDAPLWKHPARTRNTNDRPTRGTSGMNILFPS